MSGITRLFLLHDTQGTPYSGSARCFAAESTSIYYDFLIR